VPQLARQLVALAVLVAVEDLQANLQAFLDHLSNLRSPAVKGEFFRKISISTTMGPGVRIDTNPYR